MIAMNYNASVCDEDVGTSVVTGRCLTQALVTGRPGKTGLHGRSDTGDAEAGRGKVTVSTLLFTRGWGSER